MSGKGGLFSREWAERWMERFATETMLQFSLIALTLILYLVTKSPIFGALILIEIVAIVALEIRYGVKAHGWKHELKEILVSLGIILFIWAAAMVVMQTPVPLNGPVDVRLGRQTLLKIEPA